MRNYWIGAIFGVIASLAIVAAAVEALSGLGRMPAPAISVVEHLDEKLRFLRDHPELTPELVAVGSSITWRQLDGRPFAAKLGERNVLNGAAALLRVHQTRFLANFYADHYPRLRTMLMMLGPTDLRHCDREPETIFDKEDAAGYIFERRASLYYYFKYFAPLVYLRRAYTLERKRVPLTGEISFDRYGSGAMQWTPSMMQGLRYEAIALERPCIDALHHLVSDLSARGIRPVVVFPPIHPEYRQLFPQTIADLKAVIKELREATGEGVQIIDFIDDAAYGPDDFFDAFHLQWSAVQPFSEKLAREVLQGPTPTPTSTSLVR